MIYDQTDCVKFLKETEKNRVKIIHNLSNTAVETTKNRCLERKSNSHLTRRCEFDSHTFG